MSAELFVVRESFPLVLISLSLNTQFKEHYRALLLAYKYIHTSSQQEQQQHITLSHARDKKEREREN